MTHPIHVDHGVHRCASGHLAQLELEAPAPLLSNVQRGHRGFPASLRA